MFPITLPPSEGTEGLSSQASSCMTVVPSTLGSWKLSQEEKLGQEVDQLWNPVWSLGSRGAYSDFVFLRLFLAPKNKGSGQAEWYMFLILALGS